MERILFYFFVKPISLLPWPALYFVSNVLYLIIYKLAKYRVKVVKMNLKNSFPDMTEQELLDIETKYYRHLADVIVEIIKMFSIKKEELLQRCKIVNPEILDTLCDQGRSAIMVGGHYNNWEYVAVSFDLQIKHHGVGIYAPMSNKYFAKKFYDYRTQFNLEIVPINLVTRSFIKNKDKATLTVFATDQSPTSHKSNFWMEFLHQETGVASGAEKFAKHYNYPVVYASVSKVKRGHYEIELVPVCTEPKDTQDGYISFAATKALEKDIIEHPEYWLWSHKRWKRQKPEDRSLIAF